MEQGLAKLKVSAEMLHLLGLKSLSIQHLLQCIMSTPVVLLVQHQSCAAMFMPPKSWLTSLLFNCRIPGAMLSSSSHSTRAQMCTW